MTITKSQIYVAAMMLAYCLKRGGSVRFLLYTILAGIRVNDRWLDLKGSDIWTPKNLKVPESNWKQRRSGYIAPDRAIFFGIM